MGSVSHHPSIGKWFKVYHRDTCRTKQSSKERQRAERAQVHAMVSVARVAAAVASHCVEAAQHAGARREQVACAVQTAVGVRSPGDMMTLTAAAATGMESYITDSAIATTLNKVFRLFHERIC
jgi:RNA 3'-terminal phosphate cyclase